VWGSLPGYRNDPHLSLSTYYSEYFHYTFHNFSGLYTNFLPPFFGTPPPWHEDSHTQERASTFPITQWSTASLGLV